MSDPNTPTATLIKAAPPNEAGAVQHLYRLDPPLQQHEYVVVSAVVAMFSGPETYIFPADSNGGITDWAELPGSFRGALDHERALARAGYEVS